MLPTLASVRALNMKQGRTLPIFTHREWNERMNRRKEDLKRKPDIKKLLSLYDPGIEYNKDASWGPQDHRAWGKL